jgi:glycyl-tRNA synthetase beta chain
MPTSAAAGFAAKQGVEVSALERAETPKGVYLAYRKRQRGKAAVDVLPDVLGGALRALTFPKLMHWDALLEDGRGDLLFGRPIRWMLFLYGGRVVPLTISRTSLAQSGAVQDVTTGAVTYGHRFLTTSGRAGRAIKVRLIDDTARACSRIPILERSERHRQDCARADARPGGFRAGEPQMSATSRDCCRKCRISSSTPSVIAGIFAPEFLQLPDEVLTTTLIHHQHYFPVEDENGKLKNAFLAVINTEPDNERTIARNAERVVSARLTDAQFFWEADRKATLESRIDRLATLVFHKKLGTYKEKAERIERLAGWIARQAFGASDDVVGNAGRAAAAKADLITDMVREFPSCRHHGRRLRAIEGQPEAVAKAIYYHYLPIATEADAPPSKAQLGQASVTWAAVSLADKLDTIVGLFAVGEKPTGSRDPFGLRRAAHGVLKILLDPELGFAAETAPRDGLVDQSFANYGGTLRAVDAWRPLLFEFLAERQAHVFERRGFRADEVRAVAGSWKRPVAAQRRLEALSQARGSAELTGLAVLLKRVKNITKEHAEPAGAMSELRQRLKEPAEVALIDEIDRRWPKIQDALGRDRYGDARKDIVSLRAAVDRFFVDVLVMADDPQVRSDRLSLLTMLRNTITGFADISELAPADREA